MLDDDDDRVVGELVVALKSLPAELEVLVL